MGLLFLFTDCLRRNPGSKRLGTGLLAVTGLLMLAGSAVRLLDGFAHGGVPWFTPYDFLYTFSLLVVLTSLALACLRQAEFPVLLFAASGYGVFLLNRVWLTPGAYEAGAWSGVNGWLAGHVLLANLSFTALTLSAVFAGLYLFLHGRLKKKRWNARLRRLPSLETLDRYSRMSVKAGVPLLALSLVLGGVSLAAGGLHLHLLDIKSLASVIALGLYIFYLLPWKGGRPGGAAMSRRALVAYGFLILNLLLNEWSKFHTWGGE